MNDFDKRYVDKVLALHDEMGLERDSDPETRIWLLLRSLVEYTGEHGINLDAVLKSVWEDVR